MRRNLLIALVLFTAVSISGLGQEALGDTWQTLYENDFSTDPGWTTNNAAHYNWDSGTGTYYQERINGADEYTYQTISGLTIGKRWRLETDIKPISNDTAANAGLRLFDADMENSRPTYFGIDFATSSSGQSPYLLWSSSTSGSENRVAFIDSPFEYDVWYRTLVEWDPVANTLYAKVTRRDNGSVLVDHTVLIDGHVNGVDRIGVSSVNHPFKTGAVGIAYLDNVSLSQIPEPATLSLLAIGGLALLRRRK